jgi:hypothetical protein
MNLIKRKKRVRVFWQLEKFHLNKMKFRNQLKTILQNIFIIIPKLSN